MGSRPEVLVDRAMAPDSLTCSNGHEVEPSTEQCKVHLLLNVYTDSIVGDVHCPCGVCDELVYWYTEAAR